MFEGKTREVSRRCLLGRRLVVKQSSHCEGNMSPRETFKRRNPHSCIYKTKQRNRTPKSVSQAIPGSRDSSRNPNKSTADPLVPAKEWESISQYSRPRTSQLSCCPCVSTLDRQPEGTPAAPLTRTSLPRSTLRTRPHGSYGSSPAAGQDGTSQQRHDFCQEAHSQCNA